MKCIVIEKCEDCVWWEKLPIDSEARAFCWKQGEPINTDITIDKGCPLEDYNCKDPKNL